MKEKLYQSGLKIHELNVKQNYTLLVLNFEVFKPKRIYDYLH